MSENSNSAIGNSTTVLTLEVKKSGVENVGPVAEGTKIEGDPACSSAPKPSTEVHTDLLKNSTEESSQQQCEPANSHESEHTEKTHQAKHPENIEERAQLNAADVNEEPTSASSTVEDLSSWTPDHEEQDALTGQSEGPVAPSTDADLFSDSYTHISPTSGSSTLPASGHQEGLKSEETHLKKSRTDDFRPDAELLETKEKEGDGLRKRKISHLRSLDQGKNEAEDDDDEEEEEEFQVPQREEEKVFSLNKCILAAVILLGLGTIFFSGVLLDTDDEGDIDVKELKDPADKWLNPEVNRDASVEAELPDILSKQAKDDPQILVLQAHLQQHQGELKAAQHLAEEGEKERVRREELEKDYQRIKEELDRLPALQKELEQANERMKEESERAKKELEALPSLHRELEHLRTQVSQLTQSTGTEHVHPVGASGIPSSGHIQDVPPIEIEDTKHVKHWDKKSEKESSRGEKEWKKKKSGKKDGRQKGETLTEEEHAKEQKDGKMNKSSPEEEKTGKSKEWKDERERKRDKKREDGKIGKENQEKKVFKEWDEKKDKNWKEDRYEGQDKGRKDKKGWKDTGEKKVKEDKEKDWKHRGDRKEWKEEKEWKNDIQSGMNDQKEFKGKKKEWKDKYEWKGEKEWKSGKSEGKLNDKTQRKWKGEREFPNEFADKEIEENHWRGKERERTTDGEWKRNEFKEERNGNAHYNKHEGRKSQNEKEKRYKDENEWSKEKRYKGENEWSKEKRYKGENEWSNDVKHRHGLSDQMSTHHHNNQKQHNEQDHENYWPRQREKIQHNYRQRRTCSNVADCARVEGLSPVSLQDFEILLQSYLNKIQDPEDQTSNKEELSKLVKEFFTDGVFAHDQMPFSEFVEDVADILEDMADGEDSDAEESEEDDDEEFEEFEREAMEMFALSEEAEEVEKKGNTEKKVHE